MHQYFISDQPDAQDILLLIDASFSGTQILHAKNVYPFPTPNPSTASHVTDLFSG